MGTGSLLSPGPYLPSPPLAPPMASSCMVPDTGNLLSRVKPTEAGRPRSGGERGLVVVTEA